MIEGKFYEIIYDNTNLNEMAHKEYINNLIEKDKPKSPTISYGAFFCPNCGKMFDSVRGPYGIGPVFHKHCPECGQKLNWDRK